MRPPTVVCLEDDMDLAHLIQLALSTWPVTIHLGYDGIYGLDLIRETKPDLILLDLGLPGLNGWQICAEVKRDPDLRHIPIIILSAVPVENQDDCALEQVVEYVMKPFTLERLRHVLGPVLLPAS